MFWPFRKRNPYGKASTWIALLEQRAMRTRQLPDRETCEILQFEPPPDFGKVDNSEPSQAFVVNFQYLLSVIAEMEEVAAAEAVKGEDDFRHPVTHIPTGITSSKLTCDLTNRALAFESNPESVPLGQLVWHVARWLRDDVYRGHNHLEGIEGAPTFDSLITSRLAWIEGDDAWYLTFR